MSRGKAGKNDQPRPCVCGSYRVDIHNTTQLAAIPKKFAAMVFNDSDSPDLVATIETMCFDQTLRDFAQGHDARLKSIMRYAHLAGLPVTRKLGDHVTTGTAADMSLPFGFHAMVVADGAAPRTPKTPKAPTAPAAPRTPKAAKGRPTMRAKVGRWVYEGWLDAGDEFVYTNRDGRTLRTFQWKPADDAPAEVQD